MRRILSLLLSVVLVFTLAVPAMAATVKQEANSSAIKAGEEVTVTVTLDEDVADIVMYQYSLYYNKDLFTMTGSTGSAPEDDKDNTFLGKFIMAALAQKSMVTNAIFKSGSLLAGYSVDYNAKGFEGIRDYMKLVIQVEKERRQR